MKPFARNITVLWRAEKLLAEAELRRSFLQIMVVGAAGLFALLGLLMFNVAGFYWLAESMSNANALYALTIKLGSEADVVRTLRDDAIAELQKDAEQIQSELVHVRSELQVIGTNLSKFASDPIGSLSPGLLVPAINAFTHIVKSSKSD